MSDISYVLFDTAVFGTVANFEQLLFQVAQGGDATHSESFTNSRGAGILPQEEAFMLKRLAVWPDFNTALVTDYQDMWRMSFIEIRVSDRSLLKLPLILCAENASWGGFYTQTAAANDSMIGPQGDGYELDIPIAIGGGVQFKVRVFQAIALSGANLNVKIGLNGTLTIK